MVLFSSVKFIFSLFENLFEEGGTTQNVRLSAIFLTHSVPGYFCLIMSGGGGHTPPLPHAVLKS